MVESCLRMCIVVLVFLINYSHVKREGNKVTHNLARYTKYIFDFVVCIESVPPHYFPVFQADLTGIT